MRSSASGWPMSNAGQVRMEPDSSLPTAHCRYLPEDILHAVEDATLVVLVPRRRLALLFRHRRRELFAQLALLPRHLLRLHPLHGDEEVATRPAGEDVGHAAAAQAERGAALRALGHLERLVALEGRNGDLAPERR